MLIDRCCRLRATVAISAVEIEGGDAMLAVSTFENGAAIHRFGRVISHIFNPSTCLGLRGNRCGILKQKTVASGERRIRFSASEPILLRRCHLEVNPLIFSSSATIAT